MKLGCGCILEVHKPSNAQFCTYKCVKHQKEQNPQCGRDYYEKCLAFDWNKPHISEFVEAFGELPIGEGIGLEIGCGVSHYANMIKEAGYHYIGTDVSSFACDHMRGEGFDIIEGPIEDVELPKSSIIVSTHLLEHVKAAPFILSKMVNSLVAGGTLYLLVPDDNNPSCPDHYWFFTAASICMLAIQCRLTIKSIKQYSIVSHEDFIYLEAVKI